MTNIYKRFLSLLMTVSFVVPFFGLSTVSAADDLCGWTAKYQDAQGTVSIDKTEAYSGKSSLKLVNYTPKTSNRFIYVTYDVDVEAGKQYYVGAKIKSEKSTKQIVTIDWEFQHSLVPFGTTYKWTNFEFIYTAKTTKKATLMFSVEGVCDGVWIDDVKFMEVGTDENLIANPGFDVAETETQPAVDVVEVDDDIMAEYEAIQSSEVFSADALESVRGAFKYIPMYKTDKPMTADGNADDWAGFIPVSAPVLSSQYFIMANDSKPKDLKMLCNLAYDEQNLYMYVEVQDDEFVYTPGGYDYYWRGDSLQFAISRPDESFGNEIGFAHNPETGVGEIYSTSITPERLKFIDLKTVQSGNKTIYEAVIPWTVKYVEERPKQILFNILANDNDGGIRRYCVELAPGISKTKDSSQFPVFDLIEGEGNICSWISGPKEGLTNNEYSFDYYIVNKGESKSVKVKNLYDNTSEEINIPKDSGIRRRLSYKFDNAGTYDISVECDDSGKKYSSVSRIVIEREPPSAEYSQQIVENNKAHVEEIKSLLDKCARLGISTDYETSDYRILEMFTEFLEDDIKQKSFERMYYTEEKLNEIYSNTKSNLEAYLAGEKEPHQVPKYVTGKMTIDGKSTWAITETGGIEEYRPYFFVGYGHGNRVIKDTPIFSDLNVHTIQIETGPKRVMAATTHFANWSTETSMAPRYEIIRDTDIKYSGDSSLKLIGESGKVSGQFVALTQSVPVEGGKTYVLKGRVKSSGSGGFFVAMNNYDARIQLNDEYDWKEFSGEFTAPEGTEFTIIRIGLDGKTPNLWLDDMSFCEKGTSENLLRNGGFESEPVSDMEFNEFSTDMVRIKNALKSAEENNIAVALLISPHYMPQAIIDKYGIGGNYSSFIKYNVDAPIARQIIEQYIRGLIPIVKDYKSLNNIVISNEPAYYPESFGDFYIPRWQEYLRKIYNNDISALNAAYKTSHKSFEEIDLDKTNNPAKFYDYKRFNDTVFSEWHRWMTDIIREIAPDIPINAKIQAYVSDTSLTWNKKSYGTGYEYYHDFFDLNGCDGLNYYDDGHLPLRKVIYYDYLLSIKDAPVIDTEEHIITDRYDIYNTELGDYVSQQIYMGAIHGRALTDIWVWERSYDPSSDFAGSILFRPDAVSKVSKVSMDINRNAYEITALQNQETEVGILYSDASLINDPNTMYATYQSYAASLFNGKRVKFIVESQLEKMHDCKLMIVPATPYVTSETVTELAKYAEKGGQILILSEQSMLKDEQNLDNDKSFLDYIYKNSEVVEYVGARAGINNMTETELYDIIRNQIKKAGIYNVSVLDAETGKPVDFVEYNVAEYKGKILVNFLNYEDDKKVKLYFGDKLCTKAVDINTDEEYSEVLTLKKYIPLTIEAPADMYGVENGGNG